jgi:DNA-binding response OmpR family regulator
MHARCVVIDDKSINISSTSFDYLLVLARHTPNVVDFQTLVAEAQGSKTELREAQELSKWHIHQIRQAIEADPHTPKRLITIRGTGYRLIAN